MTEEHTGQEELQEAIWNNIHRKRLHLAKLAPLCQELLCETFDYNAIHQTSQEILDGMYEYPSEFDEATKEILQECVLFRLKILASSVNTLITKEEWGYHWGKARGKGGDLFLDCWVAFQSLQGRALFGMYLPPSILVCFLHHKAGNCTQKLVTRPLCYARKNLWMRLNHQAAIYPPNRR